MDCESTTLSEFFDEPDASATSFSSSADDIFSILEAWESASACDNSCGMNSLMEKDVEATNVESFEFLQKSSAAAFQESDDQVTIEADQVVAPSCKKQKLVNTASACKEGQQKMTHITVERNRRKQMNEHLSVLRSLMPCFYVKRGDQASIIGGVVDYINELQQILQSLEAKKQHKAYTEVLSPRPPSLSPRKPPLSPRLSIPISPSTPQQSRPYKPWIYALNSPSRLPSPVQPSPSDSSSNDSVNELVASSRSALAEVEVKFSGSNLVVKTVSHHRSVQGQVVKIVAALDELDLDILHVSISRVDETMLYSFTIKIGIECQLSAEELAEQIQQTFC